MGFFRQKIFLLILKKEQRKTTYFLKQPLTRKIMTLRKGFYDIPNQYGNLSNLG